MGQTSKDSEAPLPARVPLLPIRDLVVFPYMVVPLFVRRPISRAAVERAQAGDGHVFLVAQRRPEKDDPAPDDVFDVGTIGRILRARELPDGQIKILVQGTLRVRIQGVLDAEPGLLVKPEHLDETDDELEATAVEALVRAVKDGVKRLAEFGRALPKEVQTVLLGLKDAGSLADLVAANLGLDVPSAQSVLEVGPPRARLRKVQDLLTRELDVVAWQQKIQSQAKEEMSRTQREYFLREQLKQIQQELGDHDHKVDEVQELHEKITRAQLPEEAGKEAAKQLRRLEAMSAESAEAGVVRTYVEWLSELPWSESSRDRLDLGEAQTILDADHYGLGKVKDRLLEYLGVLKLKGDISGPILCFVGPPGVGKTSLGRSIARALGRSFVRISLGGVHDEAEIRGHRRTYVGAMPGRIIQGLKQAKTNNPVCMLDEIDKLGRDGRGDPAAALLEVLDAEQNDAFRDHYLNLPFDVSKVLFVATANGVDSIPRPLRDRMELLELAGYDLPEKVEIARRFLVPRRLEAAGLSVRNLSFTRESLEDIVDKYTREAGLRELDRQIAKVTRKVARRIAEGRRRATKVRPQDLERYLGPRRHDPDRPDESDRIGLATGLAWTEAGGTILHVEATSMPGRPGLTLTGQLGQVMKESAQAALSCARSRASDFGFDEGLLRERELHLHVPHGAIPKDGPSAGITMALVLISLFTQRPVRRDVAMTGEITLRGRVLAVGGLRQKLLAAKRAGIRTVLVPAANLPDLAEIPPQLLSQLEVVPVKELDEVLAHALLAPAPRKTSRVPGQTVGLA